MEKHWKSVISRSVCDYFFDHQRKVTNPEDIPPVIATPHHYLISVHRCGMFFVAVCTTEGRLSYHENLYMTFHKTHPYYFQLHHCLLLNFFIESWTLLMTILASAQSPSSKSITWLSMR